MARDARSAACYVRGAGRHGRAVPYARSAGRGAGQRRHPARGPAGGPHVHECHLSRWGLATLDGLAPNLLVNGARADRSRAFHFLPHNAGEVVSALADLGNGVEPPALVPDLACGGVADEAGLEAIAQTGAGTLRVRARMHVENADGVPLVVLTEAPQDVELDEIVVKAAEAMREGRVRGVRDLRDESAREGLRIVFVGARGASPDEIEGALYAHTPCESSIEVDGIALVDGAGRCLPTGELLRETWRRLRARWPELVEALRGLAAEHDSPRRTSVARFPELPRR